MIHQRTERALFLATYGGFVGGLLAAAETVGFVGGLVIATGAGVAAIWYLPHAETVVEQWAEAEATDGGEEA